jgi:Sec-independent protein translocase protein TatA
MTRIVVYTNAITHSIARQRSLHEEPDYKFMEKSDTLALVMWGAERLEEEGRGVGIGMGFHRGIAKNVMHLLWALMAYGMVTVADCGPEMTHTLGQSMSRLVSYIQEDEIDSRNEDEDIQNLAQALNTKLSMAS